MAERDLIEKEFAEVQTRFPKLTNLENKGGGWEISGSIDVIDVEGYCWDTYDVSIIISSGYPKVLPCLKETSGKIERKEKWHNSLYCCLSTDAIIYAKLQGKMSILNWLVQFGHPFLANHVYKKQTGKYANEEFAHGTHGILQGYYKLFNTTSSGSVIARLRAITSVRRNDPCLCRNGVKWKNCCMKHPEKHTLGIPMQVLQNDLRQIEDLFKHVKVPLSTIGLQKIYTLR